MVVAGDTVPCAGLDGLCEGAQALVHTAIRKDIIETIPLLRMQDTLDCHSSPEEAAQTAARAGAAHFDGAVELGDDLQRVEFHPPPRPST
ncbi:hypothetical protein BH24ACT4_BH24ACT4_26140 [soil metagenome]